MEKNFKPIKIDLDNFLNLSNSQLSMFFNKATKQNEEWFDESTKNTNLYWILMKGDRIRTMGYSNDDMPTMDDIKKMSKENGEVYSLLFNPSSAIKDLEIFFQSKETSKLMKIIGKDTTPYLNNPDEKINTKAVKSGILNKLKKNYALGNLINHKVLNHSLGATLAYVWNISYKGKEGLYISSQSKREVHKRGSETIDEKTNRAGIERLHRFDDPILDIFDTYDQKIGKPSLILYRGIRLKE